MELNFNVFCIVCGKSELKFSLKYGEHKGFPFWFHESNCEEILDQVHKLTYRMRLYSSPNTAIIFGAGLSIPSGIPGYREFLDNLTEEIGKTITPKDLFNSLHGNKNLFNIASSKFSNFLTHAKPGYAHLSAAECILSSYFSIVVNTNWDFLLESIFARVIDFAKMRFASPIDKKLLNLSLDLIVMDSDLKLSLNEKKLDPQKTIFKIHGSPLLYFCPYCTGAKRFRILEDIIDGKIYCARHPQKNMDSHVVFARTHFDQATPLIFDFITEMFKEAEQIILLGCGGCDQYIYDSLIQPNRQRIWTIAPKKYAINDPSWIITPKEQRIDASPSAFFRLLELSLLRQDVHSNQSFKHPHLFRTLFLLNEINIKDEWGVNIFYNPSIASI